MKKKRMRGKEGKRGEGKGTNVVRGREGEGDEKKQ